jgi:hypothetical protein
MVMSIKSYKPEQIVTLLQSNGTPLRRMASPNDVYIDVEHREEERKSEDYRQGVGIVPHSAVSEKERRWEAQQERKKKRAGKRFKEFALRAEG